AAELHVVITDLVADLFPVLVGEREHLCVGVDTDHAPARTGDLSGDKTDLAASRTEIERDVAFSHESRRIAAAVIAVYDLLRNDAQIFRIVGHGTAQLGHLLQRRPSVSVCHRPFNIENCAHRVVLSIFTAMAKPYASQIRQLNPFLLMNYLTDLHRCDGSAEAIR